MDPQTVARLKVRHLGYGQRFAVALHSYINLGADQVKSSGFGAPRYYQREGEKAEKRHHLPKSVELQN